MYATSLLLVATSFLRVSSNSLSAKITGGSSTTIDNHPYHASLQWGRQCVCGASLIAPNKVLTSASCVFPFQGLLSVRAGSTKCSTGGYIRAIVDVCSDVNMDVAVMTLDEAFSLSPNIGVIPLVEPNTNFEDGTLATATGWGYNSLFSKPTDLQVTELPLINFESCSELVKISDTNICFGNLRKRSCLGDSGGPVVIDGEQVGIITARRFCTASFQPEVFVNVGNEKVHDFIKSCLES